MGCWAVFNVRLVFPLGAAEMLGVLLDDVVECNNACRTRVKADSGMGKQHRLWFFGRNRLLWYN